MRVPVRRAGKTYTESEAAAILGVSIETFRTLVRAHIVQEDEDLTNLSSATFQAADLVVLRLLAGLPRS